MHCLDTSIVVDFLRDDKKIVDKIESLSSEGNIFISVITLCELYKGAYLSNDVSNSLEIIEDFAEEVGILDFDNYSCREFGKIFVQLKKSGKIAPEADIMIASIIKANDFVLITRDKKHFEKIGAKVEV